MNSIWKAIPLIAMSIDVAIGILVLYRGRRNLVNRLFFGISCSLAIWSLGEFMQRMATTSSTAIWGAKIGALGWCTVGALYVSFCLELTEWPSGTLKRLLMHFANISAVAILVLTWSSQLIYEDFSYTPEGYREVGGLLRMPSKVYVVLLMLAGLLILMRYLRSDAPLHKRTGVGYVAVATLIPLVFGIISDVMLPFFNVYLPVSSTSAGPVMAAIVGYAVIRHDFMTNIASSLSGAVISSIDEAVFIADSQDVIETVNPNAVKLTGYTENELVGSHLDRLFIEYRHGNAPSSALSGSGELWSLCLSKTGQAIPVSKSVGTINKRNGKAVGSVVVIHDMRDTLKLLEAEREARAATAEMHTERRRSETLRRAREEMKEQSDFLQGIIDNIAEPVFIKDRDHRYVLVNRSLCEASGYRFEEMIGNTDYDMTTPEQARIFAETDDAVFTKGEIVEINSELITAREGADRLFRVIKAPVKNSLGETEYLVGIMSDITEQKALEHARLDFIRIAAHELKTPLTSLKLGFELLTRETRGSLNEEQQRSLEILSLSIERLALLAKNLLDLANMDAGLMILNKSEIEIEPLLEEALGMFEGQARKKGLECEIAVDPGLGRVLADPNRMSQVLFNLIGNAVKYTDKGNIKVSASVLDDGYVEICVSDSGVGIPPAKRDSIFSRFSKVDSAETAKEGTGLGLSIAKSIIEAHGGSIRLESRSGRGSRFYFTLPKVR